MTPLSEDIPYKYYQQCEENIGPFRQKVRTAQAESR